MIMRLPVEGSEEARDGRCALRHMKNVCMVMAGGGGMHAGAAAMSKRERLVTCSPRELLPKQELPPAE